MYVIQLKKILNVPEKGRMFKYQCSESRGVSQPMKDVVNIKSVVAFHNDFEG